MLDEVAVLRVRPRDPLAAPGLRPVGVDRQPLHVPLVGDADHHLLDRDQVLVDELGQLLLGDLGPPRVAVALPDLLQLVHHDVLDEPLVGEDRLVLADLLQKLAVLLLDLVALQRGQARETHLEDRVRLDLREVESRHEPASRLGDVRRGADRLDHLVDPVEGDQEPLEDVRAMLRLLEEELGPATDHLHPVVQELAHQREDRQRLGPPVHERDHDDRERVLERGGLVEVVQGDAGVLAPLQLHDDAHPLAIRLVVDRGDALDPAGPHALGDLLDEPGLVQVVGDLGDDDRLTSALPLLELHPPAKRDVPAAPLVGLGDAVPAAHDAAGGEVGPGHEFHDLVQGEVRVLHQRDHPADHLGEVVRRNGRRHADRDPGRAVHEEVREHAREDRRLFPRAVVVGDEVDGVLVEVQEHLGRGSRQPRLGVPHRRRGVAVHRAEVPLGVHEGVAHGEVLAHAHQRRVDDLLTVGVVVSGRVSRDLGALPELRARGQPEVVHGHENPPLGRLQAVADVRQGPAHDYAHRVPQVRVLHLVLDAQRGDALRDGLWSHKRVPRKGLRSEWERAESTRNTVGSQRMG